MQKSIPKTSSGKDNSFACRLKKITGRAALASGILLASWLTPEPLKAQSIANNYDFSASSGTYTPLGASATNVAALLADDAVSGQIPIGFTFNFDGTNYTNVVVSSNGFISFNTSASSTATNNLATSSAATRPLLAPLWDDLDGRATGSSKASYETTGTTGSKVFTFEWNKWEWNYSSSNPVISFQVKLYEGSNKIEFIYQQESGAVVIGTTLGASIGIAGSGTGAGNFMSLNNTSTTPTASTNSETTNISTKPATGQIYTFTRAVPSALDVLASGLVAPTGVGCYGPNQTVQVSIKNNGTAILDFAATPVTVNASATLNTTTTNFPAVVVNTGTLAPGASQTVTVSTTYNMSTAGTYTFNAAATVTGDGRTSNDAMAPAPVIINATQVPGLVTLPQTVDFTGFTGANLTTLFPNWYEATGTTPAGTSSAWTSPATAQVTQLGSTTAKINLFTDSRKEWIVGPKVTAAATTALKFKAAVTDYNSGAADPAGMTGTDDKVQVMVSTNCGVTFTSLLTINASNNLTNSFTDFTVPLGTYAGQEIIVAFYATDGPIDDVPDYDFHLDDIFLGTPPTLDLGATALVSPVAGNCFGNAESVIVTIQNFGPNTLNFATNPATVTVNVTGAVTQTLTATVNTGTLAAGASQNVTVSTLNMTTNGTYTFVGSTTLTGDGNAANNAFASVNIAANTIATFPYTENFDTFTSGANATGFANGWSATPANTTSSFRWNVNKGTTPSSDTGPAVDHTSGTATGTYIFTEASNGSTGSVAELYSPCINLAGQTGMGLEFWYHMYGATTGTLNVDVYNGTTWVNGVFSLTGEQQTATADAWRKAVVNLSAFNGSLIKVRFRAVRGGDFTGDISIDDVRIFVLPALDLAATTLTGPVATGCYSNAQPVIINITNAGAAPINFATTPATVTVNVTGAVTQTLNATVNTGTLAVGASQTVTVGNLNMTAAGNYSFNGTVAVTGDGDATNNAIIATTRTVTPIASLPQNVDFSGFTGSNLTTLFPTWYEATGTTPTGTTSAWTNSTGLGGPGNTSIKINLYTNSRNEWIVGPKITPTAATSLRFKVAVTDFNNLNADPAGMTGTDDKVQVMVSTDCGATFSPIYTFNANSALTNVLAPQSISLSAYAGQNIIVAFYATDGPIDDAPDYDFHIDDIQIKNILAADAGAVKLITANSGCGLTNAENICVVVRNEGTAAQSNIPVSFRVNNGTPVTETIAGPIQPGDTLRYCFTGKANFLTAGNYNLKVYTTLSGDTETANDTISKVITSFNANFAVNNVDRCGPGAVTFTSNAPAGATVNWFTTATGGTPVSTGNTYSPTISGTTTYYAQLQTSASAKVGKASTTGADGKNNGGGLKFNAALPFMLDSVVVYTDLAAGGNLIINLKNAAGTVINTTTYALPAVTGMTAVTIPLKWNIPAGSNYTLEQGSSLNLFRDTSAGFPYVSLAQAVTITDGTLAGYYYFFYNWSISVGCTNPIIPVTATVNPLPATPTISAAGATTFCTGGSVALTAASTTTGATYAWYLNGTAISGATSATYTANAAGNYTVIASAGGCPSAASAATAVTVNTPPATPTITQNGGTLTSSATTGNQWYLNGTLIPGATGQTLITTANGTYTVIATSSNGCPSATSAATNVTNTGLNDVMAGMSVQVYPNPATGSFNVKLNGYQKDANVVLYSLTGQQLIAETATADGNARNISLKGLAAGTYLLKVSSDKGVQVTRLIVQ